MWGKGGYTKATQEMTTLPRQLKPTNPWGTPARYVSCPKGYLCAAQQLVEKSKCEEGCSWVAPGEMHSISLTASFKLEVERLNETDNPTG